MTGLIIIALIITHVAAFLFGRLHAARKYDKRLEKILDGFDK
jgi:uncharacterized membrane protein YdjX (TVP38/TMEM64 family)